MAMSEEEQQLVESAEQEDHVGRVLESIGKCNTFLIDMEAEVKELQAFGQKELVQALKMEHDDQKAIKKH